MADLPKRELDRGRGKEVPHPLFSNQGILAPYVGSMSEDVEMGDTHRNQGAQGSTLDERGQAVLLGLGIPILIVENLSRFVTTTTMEEILR